MGAYERIDEYLAMYSSCWQDRLCAPPPALIGTFIGAVSGVLATVIVGLAIAPGMLAKARNIARTKERRRIALNLHDGVGHGLVALTLHARRLIALSGDGASRHVAELIDDTAQATLADLQETLGVLRSDRAVDLTPDEETGDRAPFLLSNRLLEMARRLPVSDLEIRLSNLPGEHRVPTEVAYTAFRVAQEGLTNALRHQSDQIRLEVQFGDELQISIINRPSVPGVSRRGLSGSGLAGLRERVTVHGGRLHSGPRPGGDYLTSTVIPLSPVRLLEEDPCGRSAC
ncbi:Histidine kinase [Thermostaphylospora chromogena]|uniref:histidine kinase n=2 Tax=Thermostaphylospora chromogena TaxID=35622 RepID=A0A1H1I1W5_9ACTN|nr:Histidine kinase [Thermostaphylospora chromogena]